MRSKSGFFNRVPAGAPLYQPKKPAFIDVGGIGDCGFRAAATAMVDNILERPARENQELANYLLKLHSIYFPQQNTPTRLLTPVERLKKLVEAPVNRAKFVLEIAFALRQATVDELCKHPEIYRGAFADETEGTDPQTMRQPNTWIDETAIAALSNTTGVPIRVQLVEPNKELPLTRDYNSEMKEPKGSPITVQLQSKHYLLKVSNPENFALLDPKKGIVGANRIEPSTPIFNPANNSEDPDLTEILSKIAKADEALVKEFEQTSIRLQLMVANGELTKDDLMNIYIEGMKKSDYLEGRVKQVGIEHGNQDFFEKAIARARGVEAINLPSGKYDDQITKELVHAIARAISIGQLDHSVYENVENVSYKFS